MKKITFKINDGIGIQKLSLDMYSNEVGQVLALAYILCSLFFAIVLFDIS